MKRSKKSKRLLAGVIILIAFILFYVVSFNSPLVTRHYNVTTSEDVSIRIALITDLHSCNYGEEQNVLIENIAKENPDILLMGGDIVDDGLPIAKAEEFIKAVSAQYPCYYVSGNHEYWSGKIDYIKQLIKSYGVIILEGDCETIDVNRSKINICGIDDPEVGEDEFYKQLKNCSVSSTNNYYKILLTHRPELIDNYLEYDFDLVLAGHSHGGQWRIPGIINGVYAPDQGWFPKYAGGLYRLENTDFIVSRGLSRESTILPRIFNPPELVIVDIN